MTPLPIRCLALTSCFLLICAGSECLRAEQPPANGSNQTDVVELIDNNLRLTENGKGRDFRVLGNRDEIHINGDCRSVEIVGNHNTVFLEKVDRIAATGNQNTIYYRSGVTMPEPSISQAGSQNQIKRQDETSQGGPSNPSASPNGVQENENAKPQRNESAADSGQVVLSGDRLTFDRNVNAREVVLRGERNRANLHGSAEQLTVTGDRNAIMIEKVRRIQILGNSNQVTYHSGPDGQKPEVSAYGDNNAVVQATP